MLAGPTTGRGGERGDGGRGEQGTLDALTHRASSMTNPAYDASAATIRPLLVLTAADPARLRGAMARALGRPGPERPCAGRLKADEPVEDTVPVTGANPGSAVIDLHLATGSPNGSCPGSQ